MKTPESLTIVLHIHVLSSRTQQSLNILFDKHPMVLTDMLMLKGLGFTKQDSSTMAKATLLNMAANAKVSYPEPG